MIISEMTLVNFRQYYGTQTFNMSPEQGRRIILIHAENTFGKTAFLNAFKWCLYGKTTLPNPDRVFSNKALAEAEVGATIKVEVRMKFENDGCEYTAVRLQEFKKLANNHAKSSVSPILTLSYIDNDGKSHKPSNPQDYIGLILPEKMHPYFFFDGEDMNKLASEEDQIKSAIRNLMDLTSIDRAVKHLDTVAKKFRSELKNSGNTESNLIREQLEEIDKALENDQEKLEINKKQLHSLDKEIEAINHQLKMIAPAKELQTHRESLERQVKDLKDDIANYTTKLAELIGNKGAIPFISKAALEVLNDLEEKRQKKLLPAGIRDNFINDLLCDCKCICGTELPDGSTARANVMEYLKHKSTSSDVEDIANKLSGDLRLFEEINSDTIDSIKRNLKSKQDAQQEIEHINITISEISSKLQGNHEVEDIAKLEQKRNDAQKARDEYLKNNGGLEAKIEDNLSRRQILNKKLDQVDGLQAAAALARKRKDKAEEAVELLKAINTILVDEVRKNVEDKLNKVLSSVTGNDITAKITSEFQLLTKEYIGSELSDLDKSTAQNQITSLSFISSLIEIAKNNYERAQKDKGEAGKANNLMRGGVYPLVMDSPFGSIANTYGPRMLSEIAQLTPQVILMLSPKQLIGLEDIINENLAKEYVLIRYKQNPTDVDIHDGIVNIKGKQIHTVRKSENYPYTLVEEV